jgi:uroporphyrinogen-III synthase
VCIVGGADGDDRFQGRAWLADRLRDAGAEVSHLIAYRRGLPALDAPSLQRAQDALRRPSAHLWLFSSSLAIDHLQRLMADHAWPALGADSMALATHPRIAQRARAAGVGRVVECQPTLRAVTEKLLELQSGSPT